MGLHVRIGNLVAIEPSAEGVNLRLRIGSCRIDRVVHAVGDTVGGSLRDSGLVLRDAHTAIFFEVHDLLKPKRLRKIGTRSRSLVLSDDPAGG